MTLFYNNNFINLSVSKKYQPILKQYNILQTNKTKLISYYNNYNEVLKLIVFFFFFFLIKFPLSHTAYGIYYVPSISCSFRTWNVITAWTNFSFL